MKAAGYVSRLLGILSLLFAAACSQAAALTNPAITSSPQATADCLQPKKIICGPGQAVTGTMPGLTAAGPAEPVFTNTEQVDLTATIAPTRLATSSPAATSTPGPDAVCASPADCITTKQDLAYYNTLWLNRPIAAPGNDHVDASYRFGSTQDKLRDPHHGVEFLNPGGTPVLAAAPGVVVTAGNDFKVAYGPYTNFYGNLVVIRHDFPQLPQPLYTLYAHLSKVTIAVSATVQAGQKVGEVGMTGAAIGNHLHFEVRYGTDRFSYGSSRNPEIWLKPHTQGRLANGALAGRISDPTGGFLSIQNIVIKRLDPSPDTFPYEYYLNTYEEKALMGQPPLGDNFAIGDLAPGKYRVSFAYDHIYQQEITIAPGELTWITFHADSK